MSNNEQDAKENYTSDMLNHLVAALVQHIVGCKRINAKEILHVAYSMCKTKTTEKERVLETEIQVTTTRALYQTRNLILEKSKLKIMISRETCSHEEKRIQGHFHHQIRFTTFCYLNKHGSDVRKSFLHTDIK